MSAKKTANKKLKAEKGKAAGNKPKKVKLNIRVSQKIFSDPSVEEQTESLAFEPEQENIPIKNKEKKKKKHFKPQKEKINSEEIEKSKHAIMRFGVAFFMILIISIWVFNFKKSVTKVEDENNAQPINWLEITDEFSESMDRVKEELEEVKSAVNESVSSNTATGTEENLSASQDEINEMKVRLEELESKLENNEIIK